MGNLGLSELLVIFVIALLILGPRRLPELARALGEAIRSFRSAMNGDGNQSDSDKPKDHDLLPPPPSS